MHPRTPVKQPQNSNANTAAETTLKVKKYCPANAQTCNLCIKKNNFSTVCQSATKRVHEVDETDDSSDCESVESCFTKKATHGK
jgi:hypothetical protein